MMTLPHPAARAFALAVLATSLAACPGVRVAGRTVVPPVGHPAVHVPTADVPDGEGVIPADGQTTRGLAAPTVTTSAEVLAARAATGCHVGDHQPRIPARTSVADPWLAVDDGRPAILPHRRVPTIWLDDADPGDVCDARLDHCLRDCTWLVVNNPEVTTSIRTWEEAYPTDDGFAHLSSDVPYEAYRTVPVTRRNLEVGALVVTIDRRTHGPRHVATVASIDWDAGTFLSAGAWPREYPLAYTRVVVLRATPDGRVDVVNGFTRETARVRPDELILPPAARDR